jgi:hypothetical protein
MFLLKFLIILIANFFFNILCEVDISNWNLTGLESELDYWVHTYPHEFRFLKIIQLIIVVNIDLILGSLFHQQQNIFIRIGNVILLKDV